MNILLEIKFRISSLWKLTHGFVRSDKIDLTPKKKLFSSQQDPFNWLIKKYNETNLMIFQFTFQSNVQNDKSKSF